MLKNTIKIAIALSASLHALSQTQPNIGTNQGQGSVEYWSRAGNNGYSNNLFGTKFNSPIYTVTGNGFSINGNTYRSKLNSIFDGTSQYSINGYGWGQINTTGYMLLGVRNTSITDNNDIYSEKGAFSLLHLNGEGSNFQEYGYRPWMKTGITFTGNRDLSYFGLRKLGTGEDITETTITWSDNADASNPGPDDMVFRFTSGGGSTAYVTDFSNITDMDGLHVSRFTSNGRMGLGNTFGINVGSPAVNYNNPQSLLHMSYQFRTGTTNQPYGFMQISYRRPNGSGTDIIGQGETANDGLRLGIDNTVYTTDGNQHLNGYLRWQENSPFIVQTDWDNNADGITNGERMRISSIGAPGVSAPAGAPNNNITRVAISHAGDQPITNPRSLLHLGYNTSTAPIGGAQLDDGWRNWMDVGTFTNNGSDNMYVGLKNEGIDRHDAIVSWGDNQAPNATGGNGPDKLRFIFTSTTTALPPGEGDPVSQSNNGLEVGRFFPAKDTVFTYNVVDPSTSTPPTDYYGRFGVGDFTSQGVNEEPTHKLDVVGNGRFRFLPDSLYLADSTVNKIVMVDSMGVLRWSSYVPSQFGVECSDSTNGKLQFDTKVDLNNYNMYFTKNDSLGANHVGVGYDCGVILPAKLSSLQSHPLSVDESTIGISGINTDIANVIDQKYIGTEGQSIGLQTLPKTINMGGYFVGANSNDSYGLLAEVPVSSQNTLYAVGGKFVITANTYESRGIDCNVNSPGGQNYGVISKANGGTFNYGGNFIATGNNSTANTGVNGSATGSQVGNYGGFFDVTSELGATNIAMYARTNAPIPSSYPTDVSIAVYGRAGYNPSVPHVQYAGYFDGDVFINGPSNGTGFAMTTSDEQFKLEIDTLETVSSIIEQLIPRTFYFDTLNSYGLKFSNEKQYGLIAQEVETIIPELVSESYKPAEADSLGNIITQGVNYKTLNYNAFISILLKAHQEQQTQLDAAENYSDSLENVVTDLNNRLSQLENCLSGILPFLCQLNNSAIAPTQEDVQRELAKAIDVQLSDKNNIILNQNVPNPFAEKTVISYSIPETVGKAQIHFYDGKGTLINTVDIVERGRGEINVYANDLSSGVYTYSLVADGQIVSTKRMMKQ